MLLALKSRCITGGVICSWRYSRPLALFLWGKNKIFWYLVWHFDNLVHNFSLSITIEFLFIHCFIIVYFEATIHFILVYGSRIIFSQDRGYIMLVWYFPIILWADSSYECLQFDSSNVAFGKVWNWSKTNWSLGSWQRNCYWQEQVNKDLVDEYDEHVMGNHATRSSEKVFLGSLCFLCSQFL